MFPSRYLSSVLSHVSFVNDLELCYDIYIILGKKEEAQLLLLTYQGHGVVGI